MAAEASRSSPSPDSYIGCLISLTSKSEIRYEGILYNINTEESSIGLRNVRSFGTEGRKKDGQQLPASDKIYEFILFRGTDIKDLQVKASPPAQTTMQNDPAIIQLNYPHPPTASPILPANLPFGSVSASELSSSTSQLGFQHPSFQGSLPTYQPGGSFGTWSATPPPPMTNVSGLAAPMYWQGYYAHSQGLSHLQQPPLMRPQPGLAMPPMQQTLQFQGTNALLSSGSSNYPEFPLLFPPVNSNLNLASTSFPSTVAPIQVASLTSEMSPFLGSNKTSLPPSIPSVMLPPVSSLAPSLEASASLPQILPFVASSKPRTGPFSSLANQTETRSTPPIVGSVGSKQLETSVALLTPDQLVQHTPSVRPFSQSVVKVPDEVEVKPPEDRTKALLSERSAPESKAKTKLTSVPKEPILPLPSPAHQKLVQLTPSMRPFSQSLVKVPDEVEVKPPEDRTKALSERSAPESKAKTKLTSVPKEPILPLPSPAYQKPNGAILHATQTSREYGRGRGRGRGSGYARPIVKFSEEFDFTAMNEKFNKDKVWGSLGKNKAHSSNGEEEEADQFGEDNAESLKFNVKPFYVKDDFFDTLSCNTNGQTSNGRIKFSEQLKIDNETFGNFQWNNSAYGGHGHRGGGGGGGGRGRSSYPGRSYGYFARGRGYNGNNRAS